MYGAWGTICDDYWDMDDANVACRQLGLGPAVSASSSASYGKGTGPIWLDDVQCFGSEENILACHKVGVLVHNCGHHEDAGVKCRKEIRLVGGTTDDEGRIEIFLNGAWGTICDDSWGMDDANVACRQLGYSAAEVATSSASYGAGTGQIWLDDVQCDGSEGHILACNNNGVGVHNCGHGEDAGVKCENPPGAKMKRVLRVDNLGILRRRQQLVLRVTEKELVRSGWMMYNVTDPNKTYMLVATMVSVNTTVVMVKMLVLDVNFKSRESCLKRRNIDIGRNTASSYIITCTTAVVPETLN
ncbi:putative deleted in malignant brain tumors 1 protein [Apostichopus japonicus]|uniref:Putative deleted in malignant brain tumors 1 protein n=1 Tax=Stichopus japonicus TaxID=307972 RepID=A0A2G8K5T9_STIJA|nr:putative deleted in malignant brain tumors 1 protein [Apostichopus japonicus]